MRFNHTVKYNGEFYPAGAEVPLPDGKKDQGADSDLSPEAIVKMKKEELEEKAVELGIEFAPTDKVQDMKDKLIAALPEDD